MGAVQGLSFRNRAAKVGRFFFLTGFYLWTAALPFAQMQTHRITSIGIITLLAGFVLYWFSERFTVFRVGPSEVLRWLPWLGLTLLPFLHGPLDKEDGKDFVLHLPYLLVPYALAFMRKALDFNWIRWGLLLLTLGVAMDVLHILSQGPGFVYNMVRSEDELGTNALSWISRPYLGFWLGALLLSWPMVFRFSEDRFSGLFLVKMLFVFGLMFLLLTKFAFLSLALVLLGLGFWFSRKRPAVFAGLGFLVGLVLLMGLWKVGQSAAWQELRKEGGIDFNTLSKTYANSINNRILLWRSSLDVIRSADFPWNGWGAGPVQTKLDEAMGRYNGYLVGRHLNAHNQFLYYLLRYGWPGLLVLVWFWVMAIRVALRRKNAWEIALVVFLLLCAQTENYLDREMGVQAFLLFLFLFPGTKEEQQPKSAMPPF
jgi:hypothetical protein